MQELTPRVLLVEDDLTMARVLARSMTGAVPGLRVEIARSLGDATKMAKAGADAIVADLRLPDSDADDTFAWLRTQPIRPVTVVTGLTDNWLPDEAKKVGASFVKKGDARVMDAMRTSAFEAGARARGMAPRIARTFAEVAQESRLTPAVARLALEIVADPNATRECLAATLGVALGTIKGHIEKLLASTRLRSCEAFQSMVSRKALDARS